MLEFLQMITGIFVVVYDGQHALKFHLGRAIGVVGPGSISRSRSSSGSRSSRPRTRPLTSSRRSSS